MAVIPIKCKICDENYKQGIKVGYTKALDNITNIDFDKILEEVECFSVRSDFPRYNMEMFKKILIVKLAKEKIK